MRATLTKRSATYCTLRHLLPEGSWKTSCSVANGAAVAFSACCGDFKSIVTVVPSTREASCCRARSFSPLSSVLGCKACLAYNAGLSCETSAAVQQDPDIALSCHSW
jgi:hypothetical protein